MGLKRIVEYHIYPGNQKMIEEYHRDSQTMIVNYHKDSQWTSR